MENTAVEIITIDELCSMLKIGKGRAYNLLKAKKIPAFRLGDVWKIPKQGVELFILQQSGLIQNNEQK